MSDLEFLEKYHMISQDVRSFVDHLLLQDQSVSELPETDCDNVQEVSDRIRS